MQSDESALGICTLACLRTGYQPPFSHCQQLTHPIQAVFCPQTKAITDPAQCDPTDWVNQVMLTGQQSRQNNEYHASIKDKAPSGPPGGTEQSNQGSVKY